jgi:lysophospholipase L1-like esterase
VVRRRLLPAALAVAAGLALAACGEAPPELPAQRDAPLLYVALGDSTVEGVGASRPDRNYVSRLHARLRTVYPAARLQNLGVAGATSADVVRDQLPRALEQRPHLVTLSVGPNDITDGVRAERFEDNIGAVLGALGGMSPAVVVVNLIPDLAATPRFRSAPGRESLARLTVRFNEALGGQARQHGAEVVDLYAASRAEIPARPELVGADGYHPSDAGYARWAELMWPGIASRIAGGGRVALLGWGASWSGRARDVRDSRPPHPP